MKSKNIKKLMDEYEVCPQCGNKNIEKIDNILVSGVLIKANSFERVCKCGFKITIKEF